jgi:hypothetical protein
MLGLLFLDVRFVRRKRGVAVKQTPNTALGALCDGDVILGEPG